MSTATDAWNQAKHEAQGVSRQIDEQTTLIRQTSLPHWQQKLVAALTLQNDPRTRFEGYQAFKDVCAEIKAKRRELNALAGKADAMINILASKTLGLAGYVRISANLERNKLHKALDSSQKVAGDLSSELRNMGRQVCRRYETEQMLKRQVKWVITPFKGVFHALKQAYGALI